MKNATSSNHLSDPFASGFHLSDSPLLTQISLKKACIAIVQLVGKALWNWLISSSDFIISEHRDNHGARYYQVFDPINEKIYQFTSEDEVRIWLEQRYY